jgi:hypothetical protein
VSRAASSSLVKTVKRFSDFFLQKKNTTAATQRTNIPVRPPAMAPMTVVLRLLAATVSVKRKRKKIRCGLEFDLLTNVFSLKCLFHLSYLSECQVRRVRLWAVQRVWG